jgi:hypothetical protein
MLNFHLKFITSLKHILIKGTGYVINLPGTELRELTGENESEIPSEICVTGTLLHRLPIKGKYSATSSIT